jgi:hypothetical protein
VLLKRGFVKWLVALALIVILSGGCATLGPTIPHVAEPVKPAVGEPETGWWKVGFQIKWPEDTEPSWYMDLFIAHAIISPILDPHRKDITLWRFHRRAMRDKTGHQFSFLFYSSADTAQQIHNSIESSGNLKAMKAACEIVQVIYNDTSRISKPRIEDTSDSRWSPPIRRSWPHFIMGVSQMWLNLIREMAEQTTDGEGPASIDEIVSFYSSINEFITESWQEEGRHAMLHHLNAIFGYEPVVVYEKRFLTF